MKERTLRKRTLAWVLAVVMVFTMLPVTALGEWYDDDDLSFVVEEIEDVVVPMSARSVLSVPTGRTAVFHLSDYNLTGVNNVGEIDGIYPSGDDGPNAGTFTLEANGIRVATGLTGYAGATQGIDVVPGDFGGLQPGDVIQVNIELVSIVDSPQIARSPVNNGFRIESSVGYEQPAAGMTPAADAFDWQQTPLGARIAEGAAPTTFTVPVTQAFIDENNDEWDWCDDTESRIKIGNANPPRFRIAPNIVTAWVDNDGFDGLGGSVFIIHDILIHGEREAQQGLTEAEAIQAGNAARSAVNALIPAGPLDFTFSATQATALQTAINALNSDHPHIGISATVSIDGAELVVNVTFTVTGEMQAGVTAPTIDPINTTVAIDEAPTTGEAILKAAENRVNTLIGEANFSSTVFTSVDSILSFLRGQLQQSTVFAFVTVEATDFERIEPVDGTEDNPNGTPGSIKFNIVLLYEEALETTISVNEAIPATPFTPEGGDCTCDDCDKDCTGECDCEDDTTPEADHPENCTCSKCYKGSNVCVWCLGNGCSVCRGTSGGSSGGGGGSSSSNPWWWSSGGGGGISSRRIVNDKPPSGSNQQAPADSNQTQQPSIPNEVVGSHVLQLNLGNPSYTLNGAAGMLEVAPVSIDGRTMVPFRFIGEALGATIGWDDATRTATFTKDATVVSVTIGQALFDGATYMGTPVIENGRTLVPVRFVSMAMGAEVEWIPPSTIIISYGAEPVAPPIATIDIEEPDHVCDDEDCDDEDCDGNHDHEDEDEADEDEKDEDETDEDEAVEFGPGRPSFRAELLNKDASIQFTADILDGEKYTLSFWAYNAEGRDHVLAQWSHWPENYAALDGNEDGYESPAGKWTFHEVEFTATGTDIQIVIVGADVGDIYYIGEVLVTSADGKVQRIRESDLRGHWGADVIATSTIDAPENK